jgi:hypothetical protein
VNTGRCISPHATGFNEKLDLPEGSDVTDEFDEELFAQYKKRTERAMKIVVAMFAAVFLLVLYFLLYG